MLVLAPLVTLVAAATVLGSQRAFAMVEPPAPFGEDSAKRQRAGQGMELYGFLHFAVDPFMDREGNDSSETPGLFAPTDFDADQIVRIARVGGLEGLVLSAKYHDGFCLWPSRYTDYSVKRSPWREGMGNVVREIADACRRHGLKFGVSLFSEERRRNDEPEGAADFRNQLRELLTEYGPIAEVWVDGDDPRTAELIHQLQPNACIRKDITDIGLDGWWGGNEEEQEHIAGGVCPPAFRSRRLLKTPQQLFHRYFTSVGMGTPLLLNLPLNRSGRLHDTIAELLRGFWRLRDATFTHDLAQGAIVTASNTRGDSAFYSRWNAIDGRRDSYWATDDGVTSAELILDLGKPTALNIVRLREYPPLGRRVDTFGLDRWKDRQWIEFGWGASIGSCRLVRGGSVTTSRVRLRVTGPVCPALLEIALFAEPTITPA